jgi:phage major head subunit gpT-like protein
MITNDSTLNNLRKVTAAIFAEHLSSLLADANFREFTEVIPCSTEKVDTGWLGSAPSMRQWLPGPKVVHDIAAYSYEISVKPFESTIGIHKHKLRDAQGTPSEVVRLLGLDHVMRQMAKKAALWYPVESTTVLLAGSDSGANSYDGVPMFDGSHPGVDANGAATTYSNENTSAAANDWYLIDTRSTKPVVFAENQAPMVEPHISGDHYFLNGEYLIGAEARGAAKYGEPRACYRSTAALTLANVRAHADIMAAYRDDKGALLGVVPDVLLVGRSLRFTAIDLLTKEVLSTGESNMGRALGLRLVYNPFMP